MNKFRFVLAAMMGAVVALSISVGVEAFASDSSPATVTSFYACLKSGILTKVGHKEPTCTAGKLISWNSYPASANGTPQCTGIPHEGIDLSGCDLTGAEIDDYDISYANFESADLSDAVLQGSGSDVNLSNTTMNGADLTAALTDSDLSAAVMNSGKDNGDITNSNLSQVVFTDSFIRGDWTQDNTLDANFTDDTFDGADGADLDGVTNMSTATLTGVTWVSVTCPDGSNSDSDGGTCVNNLG